ncbi:hypothetical protein [Kordia sp.]|uniref:hypothetical protein n=1 Tax=Kordia sp. TaxID=1965332 RepID=UPI003D278141
MDDLGKMFKEGFEYVTSWIPGVGDVPDPEKEVTDDGGYKFVDDSGEASGETHLATVSKDDVEEVNAEFINQAAGYAKVKKAKKRSNNIRREYNKAKKNLATDLKKGAKEFKKEMKRGKKIMKTIDAINRIANDSATRTIVTTYTSNQLGDQSILIDTVSPSFGGLRGNWTPMTKDYKIDSTRLRDIKVKNKAN